MTLFAICKTIYSYCIKKRRVLFLIKLNDIEKEESIYDPCH